MIAVGVMCVSVLFLVSGLVVIAVARRLRYVVVCVLQCVGGVGCVAMCACAVVHSRYVGVMCIVGCGAGGGIYSVA